MIASTSATSATARLFIEGKEVGEVTIKSRADSWGFGDFLPTAGFVEFAALFGNWSLLMHADDGEHRLSRAAAEELQRAERELDVLRAKLFIEQRDEWLDLSQVNIDGPLIEWKVTLRNASPPSRRDH